MSVSNGKAVQSCQNQCLLHNGEGKRVVPVTNLPSTLSHACTPPREGLHMVSGLHDGVGTAQRR